jgi:hypothetical protein
MALNSLVSKNYEVFFCKEIMKLITEIQLETKKIKIEELKDTRPDRDIN